jgi:hypothetical protein
VMIANCRFPVDRKLLFQLGAVLPGGRPVCGLPNMKRLVFLVFDRGSRQCLGPLDVLVPESLPPDCLKTDLDRSNQQLAKALDCEVTVGQTERRFCWETGRFHGFFATVSQPQPGDRHQCPLPPFERTKRLPGAKKIQAAGLTFGVAISAVGSLDGLLCLQDTELTCWESDHRTTKSLSPADLVRAIESKPTLLFDYDNRQLLVRPPDDLAQIGDLQLPAGKLPGWLSTLIALMLNRSRPLGWYATMYFDDNFAPEAIRQRHRKVRTNLEDIRPGGDWFLPLGRPGRRPSGQAADPLASGAQYLVVVADELQALVNDELTDWWGRFGRPLHIGA